MSLYTEAIVLGMTAGFIARLYMLRTDYRNYPSYPHGYIIHLSLGAIAASLAAIALPALLEEEYTAVTFLVKVNELHPQEYSHTYPYRFALSVLLRADCLRQNQSAKVCHEALSIFFQLPRNGSYRHSCVCSTASLLYHKAASSYRFREVL